MSSGGTAAAPRDISTRSNLVIFASRLRGIDNHLSNIQSEHWGHSEPPSSPGGAINKLTESTPSHPSLIDEIQTLIHSIENRVEFINARL